MNTKKYAKPKKWTPKNPEKYVGDANNIISRSSWEVKFMNWADRTDHVLKWASEELIIKYVSPVDNRIHSYFPDFVMQTKDRQGKIIKYVVEIKPSAQVAPPKQTRNKKRLLEETKTYAVNTAKWHAADAWCKKNGFEFIIITEKELKV